MSNLIIEKRRQDKEGVAREHEIKQLSRYLNKGYFIHYSNINKLGINPKSHYKTPLGIYSYPLTSKIYGQIVHNEIPFASERKYIHVFKPSSNALLDINRLNYDDAIKYANRSREHLGKKQISLNDFIDMTDHARIQTPGGRLWYYSWVSSNYNPLKWNIWWRSIGIDGVNDDGEGIIHPNEPIQAVFFSKKAIEHVDVIVNDEYKSYAKVARKQLQKVYLLFEHIMKVTNSCGFKTPRELFKSIALELIERKISALDDLDTANLINAKTSILAGGSFGSFIKALPYNIERLAWEKYFDCYREFGVLDSAFKLDLFNDSYYFAMRQLTFDNRPNFFYFALTIDESIAKAIDALHIDIKAKVDYKVAYKMMKDAFDTYN